MEHQLELLLVGSTFKRINISEIKALSVLVPPKKDQDEICEFLDSDLETCDTAIHRTQQEIALLREYRTRLVADVVTGKLDVRAAAGNLPAEEKEPPAPIAAEDLTNEAELELVAGGDWT